jgi:hypothetical protein
LAARQILLPWHDHGVWLMGLAKSKVGQRNALDIEWLGYSPLLPLTILQKSQTTTEWGKLLVVVK